MRRHLKPIIVAAALSALLAGVACGGRSEQDARLDDFAGWWISEPGDAMQVVASPQELRFGPYSVLEASGPITVEGRIMSVSLRGGAQLLLTLSGSTDVLQGTMVAHGLTRDVSFLRESEERYKTGFVMHNAGVLANWIWRWKSRAGRLPTPGEVNPDGALAGRFGRWPVNPFTGEPMRPGRGPGDYRYTLKSGEYRLVVYGDGQVYECGFD